MDSFIKKYYFSCTPDFNYLNTPYCGTFCAKPNFLVGPASGDKYIFTYVIKGKGVYNVNNKSYSLKAGCSYMIFPGCVYSHNADKDDPWEYCWFEVYGNMLDRLLRLSEMTPDYPIHEHTESAVIDQITSDILVKYNTNNIQCELYRIGLLHRIFTEIINDITAPISDSPLLEHVQSNKYISKAINFIAENYAKNITINNIADYVGLDRSYFSRLFKKVTNKTPSIYLINYQMRKAKYFFMYTNYKIAEIADLVGYKNVDQFSRMFKSTELITPSEYRKQRYTSFSTTSKKYE